MNVKAMKIALDTLGRVAWSEATRPSAAYSVQHAARCLATRLHVAYADLERYERAVEEQAQRGTTEDQPRKADA